MPQQLVFLQNYIENNVKMQPTIDQISNTIHQCWTQIYSLLFWIVSVIINQWKLKNDLYQTLIMIENTSFIFINEEKKSLSEPASTRIAKPPTTGNNKSRTLHQYNKKTQKISCRTPINNATTSLVLPPPPPPPSKLKLSSSLTGMKHHKKYLTPATAAVAVKTKKKFSLAKLWQQKKRQQISNNHSSVCESIVEEIEEEIEEETEEEEEEEEEEEKEEEEEQYQQVYDIPISPTTSPVKRSFIRRLSSGNTSISSNASSIICSRSSSSSSSSDILPPSPTNSILKSFSFKLKRTNSSNTQVIQEGDLIMIEKSHSSHSLPPQKQSRLSLSNFRRKTLPDIKIK